MILKMGIYSKDQKVDEKIVKKILLIFYMKLFEKYFFRI